MLGEEPAQPGDEGGQVFGHQREDGLAAYQDHDVAGGVMDRGADLAGPLFGVETLAFGGTLQDLSFRRIQGGRNRLLTG